MLVAEDEPVVLEFIADVLREMGYVVLEAHNGEEALHIFKHAHDLTIDLLLTDIIMPKMGGKELVYHVGHLFPETKIAYCSAYPEQLGTRNGMFDRRFPFLQKPVIKDVLKLKVKEILGEAEEESQETPPVTGNN